MRKIKKIRIRIIRINKEIYIKYFTNVEDIIKVNTLK